MKASRIASITISALALGAALTTASFAFANSGPPAPTLISPANNSATTTAGQQSASWSAVTDAAAGITYTYQSSNATTTNSDGSFASPLYTSAPLSSTTISTAGTPDGTYYWHVQATDADNATSSWSDAWKFIVNNTPVAPMISGVSASTTATTSATITWNTDQPATSQVFYGTSTSYGASTTVDSTDVTSHSVSLAGLAAGTTYHFMVESDNSNGSATSSDATFTTASSTNSGGGGSASSTPLALSGIDNNQSTATADGSYNDGWQWTFHFSVPIDETQFALSFSNFSQNGGSGTIPAANNIRYWSAESSNATSSGSAIGVTAANQYPSTMLDLTGNTGTSTADRTVDVVVQMAVPVGTASGSYAANWSAESTSTASSSNS